MRKCSLSALVIAQGGVCRDRMEYHDRRAAFSC